MKINRHITDDVVLEELGRRLNQARLARNLSQQQLADEAGVSRDTVRRIEAGEDSQVRTLVRILRVLGLIGGLDVLIPETVPSPIQQVRNRDRRRRRASGSRGTRDADVPPRPWSWGTDQIQE